MHRQVAFYSHFLRKIMTGRSGLATRRSYEWNDHGGVWLWKPRWPVEESMEYFLLPTWEELLIEKLEEKLPSHAFGGENNDDTISVIIQNSP